MFLCAFREKTVLHICPRDPRESIKDGEPQNIRDRRGDGPVLEENQHDICYKVLRIGGPDVYQLAEGMRVLVLMGSLRRCWFWFYLTMRDKIIKEIQEITLFDFYRIYL